MVNLDYYNNFNWIERHFYNLVCILYQTLKKFYLKMLVSKTLKLAFDIIHILYFVCNYSFIS